MKWKHNYYRKLASIDETISFKFTVDSREFGYYLEGVTKENLYRKLRDLVAIKHSIISAFYEKTRAICTGSQA